jgi:hypothetical protein
MSENHTEHLEEDVRDIKAALARLEAQLKKKPGRPVSWTALGLLVGIQAIPAVTFALIAAFSHPAHGACPAGSSPWPATNCVPAATGGIPPAAGPANECLRDGERP